MKHKVAIVFLMSLFFSSVCFAEILYLKNGSKVEGPIVEQTEKSTKINVRGITLTYDADEIDRIEKSTPQEIKVPPIKNNMPLNLPPSNTQPKTITNIPKAPNSSSASTGQVSSDSSSSSMGKKDLILGLIDASGARDNMNQMFGQIVSQAQPQDSDKLRGLFNVDEVIAQLVPIYDRYFTEDELKGLIAFYRSALGRKHLAVTPQIMQDSMEASMAYFQKKMESVSLSTSPQEPPATAPSQGK